MSDTVNNKELVKRIAKRLSKDPAEVEALVDATLEEIYEALKHGESVTLRFNPSQRLRALFGWSSTYKGDL
jgi:DNA-binding protein HU-beta